MTRPLFLRLSPAEQAAYEQAAGALGVARWARAVLAQAAGVTAIPRGRGADRVVRKRRAGKVALTPEQQAIKHYVLDVPPTPWESHVAERMMADAAASANAAGLCDCGNDACIYCGPPHG